jgi:hypothetical protein
MNAGLCCAARSRFTDQKLLKAFGEYMTTARPFACSQIGPKVNFRAEDRNGDKGTRENSRKVENARKHENTKKFCSVVRQGISNIYFTPIVQGRFGNQTSDTK